MSKTNVLLGVLAGVAAGAVLGILFAPEKGIETRKKILQKSDDSFKNIEEKLNELLNSLKEKFDATKSEPPKQ